MDDIIVILTVILIGILLTSFSIITLIVVITNKNLRSRPSNYPILSFLLASAIQGCSAAPFYIYKKMKENISSVAWVCDAYRFPYIYCGHMMKISLMFVAIDRLLAVRYPFTYNRFITKLKYVILIVMFWLLTLVIDSIPFLNDSKDSHCKYNPIHAWGLAVIIAFNLLPFIIIGVSYLIIWKVASKIAKHERLLTKNISIEKTSLCDKSQSKYQKAISKKIDSIKQKVEMKATITSIVLLVVYIVCWGPIGVTYMIDHFCGNCVSNNKAMDTFRAIIKYLCFSSSLLAPLVYCWMNHQYRKAASRLLGCRKYKNNVFQNSDISSSTQKKFLISRKQTLNENLKTSLM